MNITMLTNSKGGVFSFTMHLTDQLCQRGVDFNVYFLEKSGSSDQFAKKRNRIFGVKNLTAFGFIPNIASFVSFFFRDHPDLVHVNFSTLGLLAVFKKMVTNTPFVLTLHGVPQPWFESSFLEKIKYTLELILLPYVASKASSIVAISKYVKGKLKNDFGLESEVIYHGTKLLKLENSRKQQIRRELGYAEKDFIGLFVGKLHPYKDPQTLVTATKKVSQVMEDFHITIIGKGPLKRSVSQRVLNLDLSRHVDLKEDVPTSDLHKHYAAADFFVLTSKSEAFGIVLLEAMAMGLPIIASDSGATQEVVNGAGVFYKTGNPSELAKKILILIQDKNLKLELSKIGPIRVAKSFSVENMIMKYLQLFKKVVKENKTI